MIKKYNIHKKAVVLPDRTLGVKTNWGVIWTKKSMEFGLIPASLPDHPEADLEASLAELSDFLQAAIKNIDRINEYYNLTYEPGNPTHVQQVKLREARIVVSPTTNPSVTDCWIVLNEVDNDFCVIENILSGETILQMKGRLHGVKLDVVANLILHWVECEVITADRVRSAIDLVKQQRKRDELSPEEKPTNEP